MMKENWERKLFYLLTPALMGDPFMFLDLFGSLRAYPQSLTQLVFLTAEGSSKSMANNPCFVQACGGKVASMKDRMELTFARRVRVN
jgi:hypothetical protein